MSFSNAKRCDFLAQISNLQRKMPVDIPKIRLASIDSSPKLVTPDKVSLSSADQKNFFKGQLIEATVVKVKGDSLLLESDRYLLQTQMKPVELALGEKVLLKVVDPEVTPPKIIILDKNLNQGSALAQLSPFLRSLLFRHESLHLTKELLIKITREIQNTDVSKLGAVFQKWAAMPEKIDADWLKQQLRSSGLFKENNALRGDAKSIFDLKAALIEMLGKADSDFDSSLINAAIEGITSSQVKALDANINGELKYQFLLPFLPGEIIQGWISSNFSGDEDSSYWHVGLKHEGDEVGILAVDMFLKDKNLSIGVHSDKKEFLTLMSAHAHDLENAIAAIGLDLKNLVFTENCELSNKKLTAYSSDEPSEVVNVKV